MATYYYAVFISEYMGFGKIRKTSSLNIARANLVREIRSKGGEGGVVSTIPNMEILPELDGYDKRTVGVVNEHVGPMINGKFSKEYYIWFDPAKDKDYLIKSDGSITPYMGHESIIKMRAKKSRKGTIKKRK